MSEPFLGQIQMFGFNFNPRGWAKCDGQLLPISQNNALFSLLGTTYGGDGRTTFGLPDLRGQAALHQGTGPGLSPRTIGQRSGVENSVLTIANLASHNHALEAKNAEGDDTNPTGRYLANTDPALDFYAGAPDVAMHPVGNTGGGQSFTNMQPYLVINFCIATQGVFPSRD